MKFRINKTSQIFLNYCGHIKRPKFHLQILIRHFGWEVVESINKFNNQVVLVGLLCTGLIRGHSVIYGLKNNKQN
jgi:hypothetical protein